MRRTLRKLFLVLGIFLAPFVGASPLSGQSVPGVSVPGVSSPSVPGIQVPGPSVAPIGPNPAPSRSGGGASLSFDLGTGGGPTKLSSAVEIVLFLTFLTLAPAIILSMTSFTRIIIVLSFMKRAMSIQEMPPSIVVTGLSFFLTLFIMKPVFSELNEKALAPYTSDQISIMEAGQRAEKVMSTFLMKQTREADLALMYKVAHKSAPATPEEVPFHLLVPAFVLSELKTAFMMGFILFLPFLVIDIVISSVLISMGMFTLPPVVISTPFKVLLFILVDGWNLVIGSSIQSFYL